MNWGWFQKQLQCWTCIETLFEELIRGSRFYMLFNINTQINRIEVRSMIIVMMATCTIPICNLVWFIVLALHKLYIPLYWLIRRRNIPIWTWHHFLTKRHRVPKEASTPTLATLTHNNTFYNLLILLFQILLGIYKFTSQR